MCFLKPQENRSFTLNAKKTTFETEIEENYRVLFCRESNSTPTKFNQIFKIPIIFRVMTKIRFFDFFHFLNFGGAYLKKLTPQKGFLYWSYGRLQGLSAHIIRFGKKPIGKKPIFFRFFPEKFFRGRISENEGSESRVQTLRSIV